MATKREQEAAEQRLQDNKAQIAERTARFAADRASGHSHDHGERPEQIGEQPQPRRGRPNPSTSYSLPLGPAEEPVSWTIALDDPSYLMRCNR